MSLNHLIQYIASHFGKQAKEVERFLKFVVVGVMGAIIDFGTLNVLQSTFLPPSGPHERLYVRLATGTSFTLAVTSNFLWNRYWTYPDSRSRPIILQLIQFFVVNIIAVVFRLVFVGASYSLFGNFLRDVLQAGWDAETSNQFGTNMAQAFASGVAMFWNFFVNRYWTYNDVD